MKLLTDQNEPDAPDNQTQEPHQSEQSSQSEAKTASSPDFDAIEATLHGGPFGDDGGVAADENLSGLLTRDQFFDMFKGVFTIGGSLPLPPSYDIIPEIAIQPQEEPAARAASDTIYEIAEEVPAFRFLIEPKSKWLQRALVIGAFAQGKVAIIMAAQRANAARDVTPDKAAVSDDPIDIPDFRSAAHD